MLAVWRPACTAGLFSFGVAGVQWRNRLHSSLGVVCREGAGLGDEADSSLLAALACRNDKDFW
jgi:hypothetical protein